MKINKQLAAILIITSAIVITITFGCKKNNPQPDQAATNTSTTTPSTPPTITGLSTTSGQPNSVVTITGTNFIITNTTDTVKINGLVAQIDTLRATKIVITIPSKATSGIISLTVGGTTVPAVTVSYPTNFTVLPLGPPPVITAVSPLKAIPGTAVTITGTNFNTIIANDSVKFNGILATVISATSTQLVVVVPVKATTGKITVTLGNSSAAYATDFMVTSIIIGPTYFDVPPTPIINAVDSAGNLYAIGMNRSTDTVDNTIYKTIIPSSTTSVAPVVFAHLGTSNITNISAIAADASGNIYAASNTDYVIYKINAAGVVSIFAGSGTTGYADGQGTTAQFVKPGGIVVDATGNLYVTDLYRVRKITPNALVSTLAGSGTAGNTNGQGATAAFGKLTSKVTIDAQGNIYADDGTSTTTVREISPSGMVTSYPINGPAFAATDANGNSFGVRTGIESSSGMDADASTYAEFVITNKLGFATIIPLPGQGGIGVAYYDHNTNALYVLTQGNGPVLNKITFK